MKWSIENWITIQLMLIFCASLQPRPSITLRTILSSNRSHHIWSILSWCALLLTKPLFGINNSTFSLEIIVYFLFPAETITRWLSWKSASASFSWCLFCGIFGCGVILLRVFRIHFSECFEVTLINICLIWRKISLMETKTRKRS